MNTQQLTSSETTYHIPELAPQLGYGPLWLQDRRKAFRTWFNEAPHPRRGQHRWRYTDPESFLFDPAAMNDTSFGGNLDALQELTKQYLSGNSLAGLVTDLGGREIKLHDSPELKSSGVLVCSLSEAVKSHRSLVEPYLYQLISSKSGKLEAMNGALWNDGIFIFVPEKTTLTKPLHLLREGGTAGSFSFPRLLVVVGEGSELTLIDEYGGGSPSLADGLSQVNGAVEIFGLERSRINYVFLQRQASAMNSYLAHMARMERDSSILTIPLLFGGATTKHEFGVQLNGSGANSQIYGLLFGSGRKHMDNHTLHQHLASNTTSNIDFKVVLKDRSLSAYTGLIRIENDAKTCEAYQENRNLLLNEGTRAETIPELEILNEDVMCSHGATIGPIDEEMIFHVMARGIDRNQAVRMIVSGFVQPTLLKLPPDLQQRVNGFVSQRLEEI